MKDLFDNLGFSWDRSAIPRDVPRHSVRRTCFRLKSMLAEYVWDASMLEGNPFTFPEVKTLLDGVTVGGHRLSDQEQVRNLAESTKALTRMVLHGTFAMDEATFCELHGIIAREEALEWGHFRGDGEETRYTPHVSLGEGGTFDPEPTQPGAENLHTLFRQGVRALEEQVTDPFERAMAFFLFGARHQFFFDGNKRTARMMMNGILMSSGIDAISVPAARAAEFNERMVGFYLGDDATDMMCFLASCHPEVEPCHPPEPGDPGTTPAT